MKYIHIILTAILLVGLFGCTTGQNKNKEPMKFEVVKSDAEWKKELTDEEYYILREKGTERAFTGDLWNNKKPGTYVCAACQNEVFSSDTKFESGSGWPSFFKPVSKANVVIAEDRSLGMVREEVLCARCGGHLGHVFPDGPAPTGLRYCINSAALDFTDKKN
jgi:peptide-methionine (R)-S-oxide reductase